MIDFSKLSKSELLALYRKYNPDVPCNFTFLNHAAAVRQVSAAYAKWSKKGENPSADTSLNPLSVKSKISAGALRSWDDDAVRQARCKREHVTVNGIQYRSLHTAAKTCGFLTKVKPLRKLVKVYKHVIFKSCDGQSYDIVMLEDGCDNHAVAPFAVAWDDVSMTARGLEADDAE